jgi:hypothetical protein
MGPNQLVHSNLFKSVAPHIHSISSSKLLFELSKAFKEYERDEWERREERPNPKSDDLDSAMCWSNTPQGIKLWSDLNNEYYKNKYGDED